MARPLTETKWLKNPQMRRRIMIRAILATQAIEGIPITYEQAEKAYDAVQAEKRLTDS